MSYKSLRQDCPTRLFHKFVPQEWPTRVSYKSVPQECPTTVSHNSFPQECRTRVSHESVPQECPTRVSYNGVLQGYSQECPTRVASKCFSQSCSIRMSYRSVPREFPTRVSRRVMKVSHESVPQEPSTGVSPARVSKHVWAFVLEYVFAFGFVGSILFFYMCGMMTLSLKQKTAPRRQPRRILPSKHKAIEFSPCLVKYEGKTRWQSATITFAMWVLHS